MLLKLNSSFDAIRKYKIRRFVIFLVHPFSIYLPPFFMSQGFRVLLLCFAGI